ncbi:MAG TPA: hypothetical protein VK255_03815 [Patescibacteria group bacterium]|nr:hypothetical protein [Patescibacteria group bacterium]
MIEHGFAFPVAAFLILISLFEGRHLGKSWQFSILPVFFTISSTALLYLIGLPYEQHVYTALAFILYYMSLFGAWRLGKYPGDKTAQGMNMAATAATIFFAYAGAYGLYLNFLVPLYWLMISYMIVTLLVSFQYFSIIYPSNVENVLKGGKKTVWIYSFLLALAMAEIIWTMNFWPFGYLTTGVIALILYYVLWDIIHSHFLNILSKKRVMTNMTVFSLLIMIILLSSKWIPVI